MARKEALLQFQSRLAERLKEARVGRVSASWLGVEAGGIRFLIPLSHAGEIHSWQQPQHVPYTQPWFAGVANLRGALVGVIDLARLTTGRAAVAMTDPLNQQRRLVSFNPMLEINAALLVERLAGLRSMDVFVNSDVAPAGSPAYFGHRYLEAQGHVWQEINLQLLSQQPEFLNISA